MRRASAIAGLCATLLVSGCFMDPDIREVVDSLEWELAPATLDPVAKVRLGSGSLGLAKAICGMVPDCREEGLEFLRGVDEVHVGVFEIVGDRWDEPIEALNPDLRADFAADGWDVVVSVRDHDETVWVMAKVDQYEILGLYVVAMERDEVVVVRLEGDLTRTLDAAVRRDRNFLVSVGEIGGEI